MNNLGVYYDEIKKDYPKAIEWYTKSIDLGNSSAMFNLGIYYKNIEKNYPKAIEWWIKSANLGNTDAMFNLGVYYYIKKDYPKAIEWYTKSANLGNKNAMNCLKNIILKESDYDCVYNLMVNNEQERIRDILLDKFPSKYIYNQHLKEINNLKSIKNQGIDKVLINQVLKHF